MLPTDGDETVKRQGSHNGTIYDDAHNSGYVDHHGERLSLLASRGTKTCSLLAGGARAFRNMRTVWRKRNEQRAVMLPVWRIRSSAQQLGVP